jgi:hypothetical protein
MRYSCGGKDGVGREAREPRENQAIDDLARISPGKEKIATQLTSNWLVWGSGGKAKVLGKWWGAEATSSRSAYRSLYDIREEWNSLRSFTVGSFKGPAYDPSCDNCEGLHRKPRSTSDLRFRLPTRPTRNFPSSQTRSLSPSDYAEEVLAGSASFRRAVD